jgi:hypothetical protein
LTERRAAEADHARLVHGTVNATVTRFYIRVNNDGPGPLRKFKYTALVQGLGDATRIPFTDRRGANPNVGAYESIESDCLVEGIDPQTDLENLDAEVEFTDVNAHRWGLVLGSEDLFRVHADGSRYPVT